MSIRATYSLTKSNGPSTPVRRDKHNNRTMPNHFWREWEDTRGRSGSLQDIFPTEWNAAIQPIVAHCKRYDMRKQLKVLTLNKYTKKKSCSTPMSQTPALKPSRRASRQESSTSISTIDRRHRSRMLALSCRRKRKRCSAQLDGSQDSILEPDWRSYEYAPLLTSIL